MLAIKLAQSGRRIKEESRPPNVVHIRDDKHDEEPKPSLDIKHSLPDVVPLPDARGDALLIHPQAFDGNQLVISLQEFGCHGRIRHEDAGRRAVSKDRA